MSDENDNQLPLGINTWWGESYDKDGKPFCVHRWVKYIGFTEKYEFCEKCDEKRNLTEDNTNENTGTGFKRAF